MAKADQDTRIEALQDRCDALESEVKALRSASQKALQALEDRQVRLEAGRPLAPSPLSPPMQREARGDRRFITTTMKPVGG